MDRDLDVTFHTFGCKVNTYDTGLMQKKMDIKQESVSAERKVHIFNTCAVTQEATDQAVKAVKKIKLMNPESKIVVTGCAAQVDTEKFAILEDVDLIVANSHKHELNSILQSSFSDVSAERIYKSNIFKKEDLGTGGGEEKEHTRAFLKIQDGCNSFCSFCIIPYARGISRSLTKDLIIQRVSELSSAGVCEVVLTGVHIGDYYDTNADLGLDGLVEEILKSTGIQRIRLGSLEPIEVTDRLLNIYQNPRVAPHFHMSIQSAHSGVLSDMKRKYTQEQVVESLFKINQRVPHAFVGMDVITGFPTETDEAFETTYRLLSESPWTRIHVFPYSEREGTRAAQLEKTVPMSVRKDRAKRLRELSWDRLKSSALKQIGCVKTGLVLSQGKAVSPDYWTMVVENVEPDLILGWRGEQISLVVNSIIERPVQQDIWLSTRWVGLE